MLLVIVSFQFWMVSPNLVCAAYENPLAQMCSLFQEAESSAVQNITRSAQSLQQLSELVAPLKRTLTSLDEFKEQLTAAFRQSQNESLSTKNSNSSGLLTAENNSTNSSVSEIPAPKSIYNENRLYIIFYLLVYLFFY
jgi:hypothetical protein